MEKEKKSYNLVIGIVALIVIIFIIAIVGYFVSKPKPLTIQGEAEASEYRVSGKVPGRIEELYVKEGQMVHKGDTVAFIDSPEVRAKLAQANALKSAASAQNRKAQNGARKEQIAGAYELYQQALVQEDVMKKSFDRIQALYDQKVIAAQKYDGSRPSTKRLWLRQRLPRASMTWLSTVPVPRTRLPPRLSLIRLTVL